MKVLLVDDDAAALEIRRLLLERQGLEVQIATSVDDARAAFASFQPDTIVMDLRIPDAETGIALIREFHPARIIVLSGNIADLDHRPEAKLVAAILQKPARSQVLIDTIQGA